MLQILVLSTFCSDVTTKLAGDKYIMFAPGDRGVSERCPLKQVHDGKSTRIGNLINNWYAQAAVAEYLGRKFVYGLVDDTWWQSSGHGCQVSCARPLK